MKGIGIDIVALARVERLDAEYGQSFRAKVMGPGETADSAVSLATLWAAKEAVAKSMGTGFRGFGPRDIIIHRDKLGAPTVELLQGARTVADTRGVTSVLLSISHDAGVVVACAVAL